jgi:prepilin-type N-terminal cleavage/methylation domain-containing protein
MAPKYTILKVLTRTSNKGFTLLELLVGMIITLIVGGLAMNAFINASKTFSQDKKSIDSNQNLSAVLEIIGNDIWQSGEQISDNNFPTIEFSTDPNSTATPKSSKITVRRALSDPLTLCQELNPPVVPATTPPTFTIVPIPTTAFTLLVADNTPATVGASSNCDVGTATSQLLGSRPSASYPLPIATAPAPVTFPPDGSGISQLFPIALRKARDYRCEQYDPNPSVPYDSAARSTEDFCTGSAASQKVRVAVSDRKGHILVFDQTSENAVPGNTADSFIPTTSPPNPIIKKYSITVDPTSSTIPTASNNTNNNFNYPIGSPIYLIEERIYTLDNYNNLQVSVNGSTPSTLIKRIAKFSVSAKVYSDSIAKTVNPTPAPACDATNTQFAADSAYTCRFNAGTVNNWKTLAGVKIQVQAKDDSTDGNTDPNKLTAAAEFFPRNVLSK